MVHVGVLHVELFLPLSGSLKEKRSVVQALVQRLRTGHAVSVAEVEHQELWQRCGLAVGVVSGSRAAAEQVLSKVLRDIDGMAEEYEVCGHLVEWR